MKQKINLQVFTGASLSRKEMRELMAGSGSGDACASKSCTKDGRKETCYTSTQPGGGCLCLSRQTCS